MNVPAHLIFGAAAFARPNARAVTLVALAGSFAPDLSLFAMAGWALFVAGTEPGVVFGQSYFSDAWQQVFAVDNSFVFWGIGLALAAWARLRVLVVFALAGIMHLGFDFALHNADARMQFWPLSDWKFASPLSYWDPRYNAAIVAPTEAAATLLLAVVLFRRFKGIAARGLIGLGALGEVLSTGAFGLLAH